MIQLKPGIQPASLSASPRSAPRQKTTSEKKKNTSLHFKRLFSDAAVAPVGQSERERRNAEINDDCGKVIFKQGDIEGPQSWSALATKIAVSKYLYVETAK